MRTVWSFWRYRSPEGVRKRLSQSADNTKRQGLGGVEEIDRASYCCGTDLLVPCMNACISSWVSRPSLLLSIALKIRS